MKAAKYCDGIFAVGDYTLKEIRFLGPEFLAVDAQVAYNGVPCWRIDAADKMNSRRKLRQYCKTLLKYEGAGHFQADTPGGKNLHYGIREHAMGAIVNGLSLSKLRPFGATFFIFSDYARPAIRLSALMELPTLFVFTHDAMGDGEDGPTHQPVEQLVAQPEADPVPALRELAAGARLPGDRK